MSVDSHRQPGPTRRHRTVLLALLGLVIFLPMLLRATTSSLLPEWLGAALALVALFGALLVFWRAGALRLKYVLLFAASLALAAAVGRLAA
jgi:hypothetical protein